MPPGLQDSIANGTMCMSDENIAQAFGFSLQDEATITWEAAIQTPVYQRLIMRSTAQREAAAFPLFS